jgi:hypothetical protein
MYFAQCACVTWIPLCPSWRLTNWIGMPRVSRCKAYVSRKSLSRTPGSSARTVTFDQIMRMVWASSAGNTLSSPRGRGVRDTM